MMKNVISYIKKNKKPLNPMMAKQQLLDGKR